MNQTKALSILLVNHSVLFKNMANQINWGKIYCDMETNDAFGVYEQWSTYFIPDFSAPECWSIVPVTPFTADLISILGVSLTADTTQFRADKTQL